VEKSSQNPSFGQGLELAIIIEKALASAVKKTNADSDKIQKVIGKPGVIFNFFESLLADDVEVRPSILKLIPGGEKLIIEALGGKAYISNAKEIFKSYIDEDFKNWGLDQPEPATPETLLNISEMISDGTFVQIFTGITNNLDKIIMTQAQIIRFYEKYLSWFSQEDNAAFCLTKVGREYFVVGALYYSDGLGVDVYRLDYDHVFYSKYRHRVVSPQLIPSVA